MDILSAIIMICIWAFIGSSVKNAKKRASTARKPGTPVTASKPAAKAQSAAKTAASAAAAAAKGPEAAWRETKARFDRTKSAYTPVNVPKAEGEETDVSGKGHAVQSSFEPGAHTHEETSMTGFKPCPPEKKQQSRKAPVQEPAPTPVPVSAAAAAPAFSVAFTREETLRAIVYSEILSKPKALR